MPAQRLGFFEVIVVREDAGELGVSGRAALAGPEQTAPGCDRFVRASERVELVAERHPMRDLSWLDLSEARERGQSMAEEAQKNRENRGRSDERPNPPEPPRGPPQ